MSRTYASGTAAVALFVVFALSACRPAQQPEPPSQPPEPQSHAEVQ